MIPDLEVSRDIAAPAETVFAAITDITRMGEWSPENYACEWDEGFSGPEIGATYIGHNRNGGNEWTTGSKITELVPGERFFFDCISRTTKDFVFAKWGYAIEATDAGCTVTEYWQDLRPESALERSAQVSGVADRVAYNKAGMEQTLERLAAACE